MADPEKPLPSLDALKDRIQAAQSRIREEQAGSQAANFSGLGAGMRVVLDLASGIAVGVVIGYLLDRWLGTFPIFFLPCFFLGVAAGALNLKRTLARMEAEEQAAKEKDNA